MYLGDVNQLVSFRDGAPGPAFGRGQRLQFRMPWGFVAGVVAILVAAEAVAIAVLFVIPSPYLHVGMDWEFYRDLGARWLANGSYYQPHQLMGPYVFTTMVDNMYPPHALLLFVPFVFLPAVLWWAIPISILGYVLAWIRPARWAWVVILVLLAWPRSIADVLTGNTDLWVVAIIAAAVRWGWPAVLVTIKPTFAPIVAFGLARPWQTAIAIIPLVVVALAALPLWFDYAKIISNVTIDPGYSLISTPLLLIPIVARMSTIRVRRLTKAGTAGEAAAL
jgi:hypothetical protein